MSLGVKIGLLVAAYLSVPLIQRMRVGCPPFGAKMVTLSNGQQVQACKPITAFELVAWPAGLLASGK